MQRRRRPKVAPRNVFGGNIPPRPQKKPKDAALRKDKPNFPKKPIIKKPVNEVKPTKDVKKMSENEILIKKSKEGIGTQKKEEPVVEEQKIEEVIEKEEQILEENILGRKTKKKTIGLQKKIEIVTEEEEEVVPSSRAMELIEKSRIRASEKNLMKESENTPRVIVDIPKKSKIRTRQKTYQPATRLKRLDRSKHMEYKYEMRSLLVEINIMEEYRSNLLASIWAKGERQSTKEAKQYIDEKMSEGVLNEDQHKSLLRVIESYTIRR